MGHVSRKRQITCEGSVRCLQQTRRTRFFLLLLENPLFLFVMSSKCCSNCGQTRVLSFFLANPSKPASKKLKTCAPCRVSRTKSKAKLKEEKRKALQPLDPNIPAKKRAFSPAKTLARPAPILPPLSPLPPRPEPSLHILTCSPLLPYTQSEPRPESSIHPLPSPTLRL